MQAKDLFSLTRTKPDGRHGLGFGVILLVMLVCIVGGLYVIKVVKWAPKREPGVKIATPSSDNVRRGGNPVEKPFVLINSLDSTPTSQQSSGSLESAYRQAELQNAEAKSSEPTNDSSQGWIPVVHPKDMPTDSQSAPNQPGQGHLTTDPMVHRGSRQSAPRNPFGPRGSQGYGSGPLNLDSPYGPNIAEGQPTEGVKYYYVSDLVVLGTPAAAGQSNRSGFLTRHFLPRGYKIPVILINQINTSVGALPVEMSIAKDVEFNGKLQVPFGWKIFGTAQAGTGIKVNVKANMILDPLGREYPINGMVLDTQQEPGFDGYPTPSPLLMQLLPIAQQTMSTFISAAQDVVTQPTLVSGGGIGGSNLVANSQVYALDAKNAMLLGTAQVLTGLMAQKTAELNKLYPVGEIVPRGTLGYLLVTSPLDLNMGTIAGSTNFLSKEEATPTPNSISIKDQQQLNGLALPGIGKVNQMLNQAQNAVPGMNSLAPQVPGSSAPTQPALTTSTSPKGLE